MDVPLKIKVSRWKLSVIALATWSNLAQCLKDFNMSRQIIDTLEDTTTHALLECPFSVEIWSSSSFNVEPWSGRFPSIFWCSSRRLTSRAIALGSMELKVQIWN